MPGRPQSSYQPVTRSPATRGVGALVTVQAKSPVKEKSDNGFSPALIAESQRSKLSLGSAHTLSFAALFLFTLILYVRPSDLWPSPLANSIALIVALAMIGCFVPTQLLLEGTLTARPREVNLVFLFGLTGLCSIPLALNPPTAWNEFTASFIRCIVVFIVMVNAVRTESRLKALLFLAIGSGVWLSGQVINDYRLGLTTVESYRAGGRGNGMFGNTNDMALHMVTMLPLAIAFLFGSRGVIRKILFGTFAATMVAAIVLSYSRGAFMGMIVLLIFMALKLARQHRVAIALAVMGLGAATLVLAPDKYGGRLLSILIPSLDPGGSADARRGELFRSLYVAIRHPLLGIGMGNYQPFMSNRGQVTHNAYTQVAAEMGIAALVCYTMFIVTPLRKLGQIARETFATRSNSRYYYLSVGLQASLLGFMVSSFFLSVAYFWYAYYLVGYAVCLRRLYEAETGQEVVVESRKDRKRKAIAAAPSIMEAGAVTT
jgi:O-antigen ligase